MSTTRTTDDIAQAGTTAVEHAETGEENWNAAGRIQHWATPVHDDFYALAREIVHTLSALDYLAAVLSRQVAMYADGRRVYDDSRYNTSGDPNDGAPVDPVTRLGMAVDELTGLRIALADAQGAGNRFWSAIGHIGVDLDPDEEAGR